ncbi:hypothetical protein T03_12302 [Trichinella britovi]|uniref:Uncharacterized protein n=1 Tax=Trichinella britovi TaxID=45882 RepID=A0A0V1D9U4_TRIBR|nr:hypothetical protein T03_12302 [Trichinella britovi]
MNILGNYYFDNFLQLLADHYKQLSEKQFIFQDFKREFFLSNTSTCVKTEMDNEQHSAPECEAKYDKEDMILEQLKIITNVQDTTKRLYSIIESRGTLKTEDALISKDENLKSQEFSDSTASKMQVSAINGSETVLDSKSVAEQKIIKRDEKESDNKLQLWANFPTGASSLQRQKQAEKNTEVCSEQQAKSCLSSTISKEYKNQKAGEFEVIKSQMIAEEQLLEMMEVPSDEQETKNHVKKSVLVL